MDQTIRDQLVDVVTEVFACERSDVVDSATFIDLGADSLDAIELVMRVEEVCNVEIADDEAEGLATFGDLVALVERKRGVA